MNELTLFDHAAAREARDSGMAASAQTSGDDWATYATAFLLHFLQHNETLHCDDLWKAGLREPTSPRALGQVIHAAAKNGWIEPIPVTHRGVLVGVAARPSVRSRYGLKQVWASKMRGEK
tara:strand:+ start:22 stop:381 length:360 start_codon:yes stop_codon:yes gene_type:complete